MFQASLIASQGRSDPARLRLLPLAVGVHALLVAGVLVAQAWTVERVPEPPLVNSTFLRFLPPPPPSGARAATAPRPPARPAAPRVAIVSPALAQPRQVPDHVSPPPQVPEQSSASSIGSIPGALTSSGSDTGPGGDDIGGGGGVGVDGGLGEAPVEIGAGILPPTLLRRVVPAYTEPARLGHVQGVVVLQAVIAADGTVTDVRVLRGLGFGLDQNAIAAVRDWRYAPARVARTGRALPVYLSITVRYELR